MNYTLIMLDIPVLVSDEFDERGRKIIAGFFGKPKLDLSLIADEIGWVDVEAELKKVYKEFAKDVHQFDAEEYINSAEQFGVLELHKMIFKAAQNEYSEEDLKYAMFQVFKNGCRSPKEGCEGFGEIYNRVIQSLSKPKEYLVEYIQEGNTIKVTKIIK